MNVRVLPRPIINMPNVPLVGPLQVPSASNGKALRSISYNYYAVIYKEVQKIMAGTVMFTRNQRARKTASERMDVKKNMNYFIRP